MVTEQTVEQKARAAARASARRAAKRGYTLEGEGVSCALCGHTAHSLVSHLRTAHALDAAGYEEAAGLELGTANLVSEALRARFVKAGAKGGEATRESKRAS